MKIEITNLQKIKKINSREASRYCEKILSLMRRPSSRMSLVVCDNRFIARLNKKFFSHSGATDVISFPLSDSFDRAYLGEVVVSIEEAVRVSGAYGNSWEREFLLYVTHGILHLFGFDDRTPLTRRVMERKQDAIMKKLCKDR